MLSKLRNYYALKLRINDKIKKSQKQKFLRHQIIYRSMGKFCSKPSQSDCLLGQTQSIMMANLNSCILSICYGNILKSPADTFLATIDKKASFNTKQMRQIRLHGGSQIFTQLKGALLYNTNDLKYGQVLYTGSGDLHFKYILFGILPHSMIDNQFSDQIESSKESSELLEFIEQQLSINIQKNQKQHLYQTIFNALLKTEQLQLNSICLPILTFDQNEQSYEMTFIMTIIAIKSFLEEKQGQLHFLKKIDIITNNSTMINIYCNSLEDILKDSCEKFEKKLSSQEENSPYKKLNLFSQKSSKQLKFTDQSFQTKNSDGVTNHDPLISL